MGKDSPEGQVAPAANVRVYFHELVTSAISRQRIEARRETEAYLVNLLAAFVPAEQLFVKEEDGHRGREPLAFMLKKAVEAPPEQRARHLRRMGDTALYMSGFFSDALSGQLVDVDYYVAMGGRAYGALGDMNRGESTATVFRELAAKFLKFVDVLNEISERSLATSDTGVLRLYERYARTGSTRLRGLLLERGVVAMPVPLGEQ